MVAMKSIFCSAALLLFVGIVSIQRAEAQCGNFGYTCSGYSIAPNGVFSATCKDGTTKTVSSTINLDNYISNIDGEMFVPGAGFSNSCDGIGWSGAEDGPNVFIIAGCSQRDGTTVIATYDINSHVSNDDGIMNWHQC